MTLVRGQSRSIQRSQASEALTGPLSNKSNDREYENLLGSNKPGPSEAFAGLYTALAGPETPAEPEAPLSLSQVLSPTFQDSGANRYS